MKQPENFPKRFFKNWRLARLYGTRWRKALRIAWRNAWRNCPSEDDWVAAYTHKRKHEDQR